jgi:hypothetical protein
VRRPPRNLRKKKAVKTILQDDEPRPQELSPCHRHPDKLCPGECQYILPANACFHDEIEVKA